MGPLNSFLEDTYLVISINVFINPNTPFPITSQRLAHVSFCPESFAYHTS